MTENNINREKVTEHPRLGVANKHISNKSSAKLNITHSFGAGPDLTSCKALAVGPRTSEYIACPCGAVPEYCTHVLHSILKGAFGLHQSGSQNAGHNEDLE